jgi:hypothetical protein
MSDPKGSKQSRDRAPRRAGASAAADASTQQPVEGRSSAATQYWQNVAAAGRATKPAGAPQADAATPGRQRVARV